MKDRGARDGRRELTGQVAPEEKEREPVIAKRRALLSIRLTQPLGEPSHLGLTRSEVGWTIKTGRLRPLIG